MQKPHESEGPGRMEGRRVCGCGGEEECVHAKRGGGNAVRMMTEEVNVCILSWVVTENHLDTELEREQDNQNYWRQEINSEQKEQITRKLNDGELVNEM